MLYLAYGSNLNLEQMRLRCPRAKRVGAFRLNHMKLVFRGVADIAQEPDAKIYLGAFEITKDCERALDLYEGFPNLYTKMFLNIKGERYMTYTMNRDTISPPSQGYYDCIRQGYKDFGFSLGPLEQARNNSIFRRTDLDKYRGRQFG
jgi:hypothetical protein